MPNSNVTIDQLESLSSSSIAPLDKLIIYDVDEEGEEPTKSVTFDALANRLISSLVIPTYDLASTNSNGLIKQIRTDVANQALVYATKPNATTAGWFAIGNNDLQADTAHGGMIKKLSNNSYDFLSGTGEWHNLAYYSEYIYFKDNSTSSIGWNLGAPGSLEKMVRLVQYSHSDSTGLGLLSITKPSAENSSVSAQLIDVAGTTFASKFSISTNITSNGNYTFVLRKNISETAYLTLVGFGSSNNSNLLATTHYQEGGAVEYGTWT